MNCKGSHLEREMILWAVRWSVAYPIAYRQLEEMRGERGVTGDHSPLNRWGIKYGPEFETVFRRRQCPGGRSGRLDEPYGKIKGNPASLYRAGEKDGHPIAFLLTPTRARDAAAACLRKAILTQGLPEKITLAKRGSNTAASMQDKRTDKTAIIIRHSQDLNTVVEQDQRAVKRVVSPRRGFKSFWAACGTLAGLAVRQALRKGQLGTTASMPPTPAEQVSALAA
jgi:putative transposase